MCQLQRRGNVGRWRAARFGAVANPSATAAMNPGFASVLNKARVSCALTEASASAATRLRHGRQTTMATPPAKAKETAASG